MVFAHAGHRRPFVQHFVTFCNEKSDYVPIFFSSFLEAREVQVEAPVMSRTIGSGMCEDITSNTGDKEF